MKRASSTLLTAAIALSILASAKAGESEYSSRTGTTKRVVCTTETRSTCHTHACPFMFLARVSETFLHAPQIFAEGIEGDRALVNKRGLIAPREVPPEDCILSCN